MIKHYCDKCKKEVTDITKVTLRVPTEAVYLAESYIIPFELCPECYNKIGIKPLAREANYANASQDTKERLYDIICEIVSDCKTE